MPIPIRRHLLATLITVLGLHPFAASAQSAPNRIPVVATFSILGDLVSQVGGDRVDVVTLAGPGQDAHVFTPSPSHARTLSGAAVVVSNGLGFEGWMSRLVRSSGYQGLHIVASQGVEALKPDHKHGHGHGHAHHHHGQHDPHTWQDPKNVMLYVGNIAKGLCQVDDQGCDTYQANGRAYTERLRELDRDVRAAWNGVEAGRRKVVTSHDAFAYYGHAYGVQFLSPQGVSTEAEASARGVARLIRQIKAENIRGLFVENISDPRLIEQIARETGIRSSGVLYSDSLSDTGGSAATYIDLVRHNTATLLKAIASP